MNVDQSVDDRSPESEKEAVLYREDVALHTTPDPPLVCSTVPATPAELVRSYTFPSKDRAVVEARAKVFSPENALKVEVEKSVDITVPFTRIGVVAVYVDPLPPEMPRDEVATCVQPLPSDFPIRTQFAIAVPVAVPPCEVRYTAFACVIKLIPRNNDKKSFLYISYCEACA